MNTTYLFFHVVPQGETVTQRAGEEGTFLIYTSSNSKGVFNKNLGEEMTDTDDIKVSVCVRCRPLSKREESFQKGRKCIQFYNNKCKLMIGEGKEFIFDHIFDERSQQQSIFEKCIRGLVDGCFQGYNATVLACNDKFINESVS